MPDTDKGYQKMGNSRSYLAPLGLAVIGALFGFGHFGGLHETFFGSDNKYARQNNSYYIAPVTSVSDEYEEESQYTEESESAKRYKQCSVCYGTGRCGGCGGGGIVYNAIDYSPGQFVDCSCCAGNGLCGMCDGSGVVEDFGW